MDPFWCITLSVWAVSKFWKHERQKKKDRDIFRERQARLNKVPMTEAEKEVIKKQKAIQKQKEKDIADLRRQGFDEELIATIIPTINNGQ